MSQEAQPQEWKRRRKAGRRSGAGLAPCPFLFFHNTSDGLDLLYHELGGSIVIDRMLSEGNAGNQVKVAGPASITNSVLVGNCAFFEGQSFTYDVDPCRALGNTISLALLPGTAVFLVNCTVYGQGDVLVGAGPHDGFSCDGSETVTSLNNIFIGDDEYLAPGDRAVLFYQEGCGSLSFDEDYGVIWSTRDNSQATCPVGPHDQCVDPQLAGPLSGTDWGMAPTEGSPAVDHGLGVGGQGLVPAVDFLGNPRPVGAGVDVGAFELQD